jgi:hypothetical protein
MTGDSAFASRREGAFANVPTCRRSPGTRGVIVLLLVSMLALYLLLTASQATSAVLRGHRTVAPHNDFKIVLGGRFGLLSLGEQKTSAVAVAGLERKGLNTIGDTHYYPHLGALLVTYLNGKVASILLSTATPYMSNPGAFLYSTTTHPKIQMGDAFTVFRSAFHSAPCEVKAIGHGSPNDFTICIVNGPHGNFTVFEFLGPAGAVPDLYGIGMGVQSVRPALLAQLKLVG